MSHTWNPPSKVNLLSGPVEIELDLHPDGTPFTDGDYGVVEMVDTDFCLHWPDIEYPGPYDEPVVVRGIAPAGDGYFERIRIPKPGQQEAES